MASEDWPRVRLGELTIESKRRNDGAALGDARLFGVSNTRGMEPMRERVRGGGLERCLVVGRDAFAYNPMRLNVGSIARWQGDDDVIVSPDYVVFATHGDRLDPVFFDFVRQGRLWKRFVRGSGSGGVRVRIYYRDIAEFRCPIPPLEVQRRIVANLRIFDDAVAASQRTLASLLVLRRASDRLLLGGTDQDTRERSKSSAFGMVPESWGVKTFGEVMSPIRRPVEVESRRKYREIGIRSHGRGIFHKDDVTGEALGSKRVFWVEPRCVVLNVIFAWEGAVAATGDGEAGMIASHRFPMFRPDPAQLDLAYIRLLMQSPRGTRVLAAMSPGGAGRNRTIGQEALRRILVPLPPIKEQHRIAAAILAMEDAVAMGRRHLERLSVVRGAVLDGLVEGSLKLPSVGSEAA